MQLSQINCFPLKSAAGTSLTSAVVEPRGLQNDRRWMVVDQHGRFLTARKHPRLVLVRANARDDGSLHLDAPQMPSITATTDSNSQGTVTIWQSDTTAHAVQDEANEWISEFLQTPCRIVFQAADDHRSIEEWPTVQAQDEVSFADGYPLLVLSTASLDALNQRLAEPVGMERFRPNLVVDTDTPFAEDTWRKVRIGDCVFDGVKRCARCVLTTVNPHTGTKDPGGEPLSTLHSFRFDKERNGILFGMNLIPRVTGTVQLNDPVVVED